jgi:hypothetical protein
MFVSVSSFADVLAPAATHAEGMKRRRILLLGVAGLLSVSALLAIGILLVGRFGRTEQRILGTTMLLAGFGLLALPSVVLFDQGRFRQLAAAATATTAVGAGLALALVWGPSGSDTFGKVVGTATVLGVSFAQTAAVAARRRTDDPPAVRRLFAGSCVLAGVAAGAATALLWADPQNQLYPRLFGALVVLDLLVVALQPVLARARTPTEQHRFTVVLASGETIELSIAGGDTATAAAKAIRTAERAGGRVVRLDVTRT